MDFLTLKQSVRSRLKEETRPIVLYGMGDGADKILAQFDRLGIRASGVFASDEFARGNLFHGFSVRKLSDATAELMARIRCDMNLITNQVIEPISALKIQSLGHHNPRLHSDEVLIALAISALTNPLADMARAQLGTLRGCDAHFSVIISEEDIKLYKRLGIHVSCEPKYESKRLYHK